LPVSFPRLPGMTCWIGNSATIIAISLFNPRRWREIQVILRGFYHFSSCDHNTIARAESKFLRSRDWNHIEISTLVKDCLKDWLKSYEFKFES
jgi:hypothetical protein